MMVKVLLYGYCVGVASSRRIAQRLHEDIVVPGTGCEFLNYCRTFAPSYGLSQGQSECAVGPVLSGTGTVSAGRDGPKLGHVALDGTIGEGERIDSTKSMSYKRMRDERKRSCRRRLTS